MKVAASVLISNYNYAHYLDDCLGSIAAQTFKDIEVIITDDGSQDDSLAVIRGWESRIRIKTLAQNNLGQASALNAAFQSSSGEVILFLDSDDLFGAEKIGRVVEYFRSHPLVTLLQHDLHEVDSAGQRLGSTFGHKSVATGCKLMSGDLKKLILNPEDPYSWFFAPSSGLAITRTVAKRIFPLPNEFRLCADVPIAYGASLIGQVALIDEPLGSYRLHSESSYASLKNKKPQAWLAEQFINKLERYSLTQRTLKLGLIKNEELLPNIVEYEQIWHFYYTHLYENKIWGLIHILIRRRKEYQRDVHSRILSSPTHFLRLILSDIQTMMVQIFTFNHSYLYKSLGRLSRKTKLLIGEAF